MGKKKERVKIDESWQVLLVLRSGRVVYIHPTHSPMVRHSIKCSNGLLYPATLKEQRETLFALSKFCKTLVRKSQEDSHTADHSSVTSDEVGIKDQDDGRTSLTDD